MTKNVYIYKASPIGDQQIQSTVIHLIATIPELKSMEATETLYWHQADNLAESLYDTLPGGTLDRLIVRLMEIKAKLLRIAYGLPEVPETGE